MPSRFAGGFHFCFLPYRIIEYYWWNPSGHIRLEDVFRTSWKGHDVLRLNQASSRRLTENLWSKTSWRRPIYVVLKTSDLWRLEDVWFISSWRRPIYDVLKTSDLRHLEDVWLRRLKDVRFTTSWKRLIYNVLKTFDLWHLEDVCKATPL